MERAAWTDERLDDLAFAMRNGFERVDSALREQRGEIGALRGEMGALRTDMHAEIGSLRTELGGQTGSLRTELGGEIAELRTELGGEIAELRHTMNRFGVAIMVALAGVIAALLGVVGTTLSRF